MRIFSSLFIAITCISCGSTYVEYDYDKEASFDSYKSYNYDFTKVTGLSEFDERRFVKYTDSLLQSRGMTLTENPDLWITLFSEEFESQSRNTLGVGVGGGGGNLGVSVGGGIPIGGREQNQLITVDFYDNEKNALVWQAKSESAVKVKATPPQRDAYFKKLVEKIYKKYPPKK
ncbi:DUF4136 domain-containing protein [Dokdonia sinensis]|uniref:DUF4136 domain-containing protein n=1 Tax=Dokdonia sinensis TaxID=2479847 RepID=A0A3M0G2H5_9FLAO|nr:DUF4136 domain-containing protein [Dokdonia sinensis]RMB56103.1 DUF4136 domain-containing protein [Dokdonia sinensis]